MTRLTPGDSITVDDGRVPGTLGCFVEDDAGSRFILTAGHVVLSRHSRRQSDPVYLVQEGRLTHCATLWDWVDPISGEPGHDEVDVAIARLNDDIDASTRIPRIGYPRPGPHAPLQVGDPVRTAGSVSRYGVGTMAKASYAPTLDPELPSRGRRSVTYRHLVLCTRFTETGDSGAPIVDRNGHIVGIHVGATGTGSFFCRIDAALSTLNVRLVS